MGNNSLLCYVMHCHWTQKLFLLCMVFCWTLLQNLSCYSILPAGAECNSCEDGTSQKVAARLPVAQQARQLDCCGCSHIYACIACNHSCCISHEPVYDAQKQDVNMLPCYVCSFGSLHSSGCKLWTWPYSQPDLGRCVPCLKVFFAPLRVAYWPCWAVILL